MKISKVEIQKNNPERFNIYIDDEFAFGLTDELVYHYKLKKGLELDEKTLEEILEKEKLNKAVNYTVYLLSFRARSEKEIRDKLLEKEYLPHQIEYAIDYCKRYNYIDDYEFARVFTRDKLNLKKHGKNRIRNDLWLKGVDNRIIEEVLDEYIDEDLEYEQALELARKRLNSYRNDERDAQFRKLSGYLARRGYPSHMVYKIVNEVLES